MKNEGTYIKRLIGAALLSISGSCLSIPVNASILNYGFSGFFAESECVTAEPDFCGPFSGAVAIDTTASLIGAVDPTFAFYPLSSGFVQFANGAVFSSNPQVALLNGFASLDAVVFLFDGLMVGGFQQNFNIEWDAPLGTISSVALTKTNVEAVIGNSTASLANCGHCDVVQNHIDSTGGLSIEKITVPEPTTLVLIGLGLACIHYRCRQIKSA